jgi:integrase
MLTVKKIEKLLRAGKPVKVTDTGGGVKGLMLVIESRSSASWVLRYQRAGIVRAMGLGSARDATLSKARELARRERERLISGEDPLAVRQAARKAERAATAKRHTFKVAAQRYFVAKESGWSNTRHRDEFLSSLERWAFPIIGSMEVAAIGKAEILRVLEQKVEGGTFWTRRTTTADRVRNRCERVLDFAEAREWRPEGVPNPARWKGFLQNLLAAPRAVAPIRHMRALPYTELPALMATLAADPSISARALQFVILTAARITEGLEAVWSELNLESAEWNIPPQRMKARTAHRVPLAPAVLELLASLPREKDNPFVFISPRTPGRPVTDMTLYAALRAVGCGATIHGFRSSFKTWANERSKFHNVEIEMSLAHRVGSSVEQAYVRGDSIEKRRLLMEAWALYCTTPPVAAEAGKVLPMRRPAS